MVVIELDGIPNVEKAAKVLARFGDQLDFTIALALTKTAEAVRDYEVERLPSVFKLRRPWWKPGTQFGFNVRGATKSNLEAHAFSRAPWLREQEYGGTKVFYRGGLVLIPADDQRQSTDRLIPKKISPRKLLADMQRFRTFWIGDNLWQRNEGKRGKSKHGDRNIRVLFFGKRRTQIPLRLDYRKTGIEYVNKTYEKVWMQALAYAIATARDSTMIST